MREKKLILGPTFEEMLHPEALSPELREMAANVRRNEPLDPLNLYNITWHASRGGIAYQVIPLELTGVDATIGVLYGKDFPTGSHKVGAAYAVLAETAVTNQIDPKVSRLIWPSTGNYGIAGAWVGGRMGFDSMVVLPEGMSQERFDKIAGYGGQVLATPGSESNVREIYAACKAMSEADSSVCVLNQFQSFGNYRFHYYVTGNAAAELPGVLGTKGVSAFVSAMGSGGTIAAGDRLKQIWPNCRVIGAEPVQCPTLFANGYGSHDIEGIGDKHATWIHNVLNMDALVCIDDQECKRGLQVLVEDAGKAALAATFGVVQADIEKLASIFGISGVCNLLAAIKAAKYYSFGKDDLIITVCTDSMDRYWSVLAGMTTQDGPMDEAEAALRVESIFHKQRTDWMAEGTVETRRRWHNLKYFTWVEQQGKTVEELNAQLDPEFWLGEQEKVSVIDKLIRECR